MESRVPTMKEKSINLALQGGGAHGAFTWGVLDRLLEEDWLQIAAISGTSAGALNGAALKAGLAAAEGSRGRWAARNNLEHLWTEVAQLSDNRMVRWMHSMMPIPRGFQRWAEMISPVAWMEGLTRVFSPYDYGPFYSNPLSSILAELPYSDFSNSRGPTLFVAATNVRSGRMRVFTNEAVTVDAVLASGCLPTLFRAIEIDDPETGEIDAFWDGGYSSNPTLLPLLDESLPRDIVVVNINPMIRNQVPKTPVDIADRINEISFNNSLMAQIRMLAFIKELESEDGLRKRAMKVPLLHMILDDTLMNDLSARSKVMPSPGLLLRMKQAGRQAADSFLEQHADNLNVQDTVDFEELFAGAGVVG